VKFSEKGPNRTRNAKIFILGAIFTKFELDVVNKTFYKNRREISEMGTTNTPNSKFFVFKPIFTKFELDVVNLTVLEKITDESYLESICVCDGRDKTQSFNVESIEQCHITHG
jgi:hypothetical protein